MKPLQPPPKHDDQIKHLLKSERFVHVLTAAAKFSNYDYLHWDELRRRTPPEDLTLDEWWLAIKIGRTANARRVPLRDKSGGNFSYAVTPEIEKALYEIDFKSGAFLGTSEPVEPGKAMRDRYIISSLMQEAVTSSQIEGAVTTRRVAREMLRTGRPPRDASERMILNNYRAMQYIQEIKDKPLSPELVLSIHAVLTKGTLHDETAAGRFRTDNEPIHVVDAEGTVYHEPPPASELPGRIQALCDFANSTPDDKHPFIHPVLQAIILHFWLAYDHPFVDGNGRTARALFYWAMLNKGFWLFEFISISSVIVNAKAQYARAFLYTETDDNDLTYFLLNQIDTICKATAELHRYIKRKQRETRDAEKQLKHIPGLNYRQQLLLADALRDPGLTLSIGGYRNRCRVAYATARADLLGLEEKGFFTHTTSGKTMLFSPAPDIADRVKAF